MGIGTVISSLFAVVFSVAIVLALAWGSLWLLRRWQERANGGVATTGGERTLRFIRALPLGPRERVVLIESDGETMLLGVTAGAVTVLSRWSEDGTRAALGDEATAVPPAAPALAAGVRVPLNKGQTWR